MLAHALNTAVALVAALLLAGLCSACGSTPRPRPAAVEIHAFSPDPLEQALTAYHDHADIQPLRAWLEEHPDHPDASLWREIVALRSYERAIGEAVDAAAPGEPVRLASADLRPIALAYPGTLVARAAQASLGELVLEHLRQPVLGRPALDFFEGGTAWACDARGRPLAPDLDLAEFRARHQASLLEGVAQYLQTNGCESSVGWCSWWVEHFPDAPYTAAIRSDLQAVWYRRAHPPWQGRRHLRCAHACAGQCRSKTSPFDDSCYSSCYAAC